jgi:hypothetical protein
LALVAVRRATAVTLLICLASAGCLLFTDDINEAPRVTAILLMGNPPVATPTLSRRIEHRLTAHTSDDQDRPESLALHWSKARGRCSEGGMPGAAKVGHEYLLSEDADGSVCVRVVAIDHQGARSDERTQDFDIKNGAPTAVLTRRAAMSPRGKVRLYALVELSGEASSDPDKDDLKFTFEVTLPGGAKMKPGPCTSRPAKARACFPAETPGQYEARLEVEDGGEPVPATPLSFEVEEDGPPCLLSSDPLPLQPLVLVARGARRTFEVRQVDDDGSPYPSISGRYGETIFVWSKGTDGDGPLTRVAGQAPTLDVSEALFDNARPGDRFRIRVEVRDPPIDQRMQQRLLGPPCDEKQDLCEVAGCLRWVTWKVQFYP